MRGWCIPGIQLENCRPRCIPRPASTSRLLHVVEWFATSLPPTTVAAFLQLHDLERYAEAFEDEGWDSLPQLQGMDEAGLMQLITDVKMK